ncbi:MAG TPA: signal peptidase II [Thermoleophilaceae bacterium]|nr:signal peptidase II [Thermoleophilaceae bacterium]
MAGTGRSWRLAAVTAALVVAADQALKQVVVSSIERGERRDVFFGVDLTYVRNEGVAFGALGDGGALVVVLTAGALLLLTLYFAFNARRPWLWLPAGAIAGGALGNLADRAREGSVIDYVDPVLWPAFNLADAAIVVGILALLYVVEGKQ